MDVDQLLLGNLIQLTCPQWTIFISDLTDSLENLISLLMTPLCRDISHPSDRKAAASSLSSDHDKNHKMVKHLEYVIES